jgi:GTP cyclohydrolase I
VGEWDLETLAVVIEARHMCMKIRGVNKCASTMQTFAFRGEFQTDRSQANQMISLLCQPGR